MLNQVQLRDFAERYTNAWCSKDPARVAAFFSLNGSLKVNDAPPAVGRAAISNFAGSFMSAFPHLHLKMDDIFIQNGRAIYQWTFSGSNTGPGGTGHNVLFSGYEMWEFSPDGFIAESRGHFDEIAYQHQLNNGI